MIDKLISTNIVNIQSPNITELMIFITNIGDKYTIALFSLITVLLLYHKKTYQRTKIFILTIGISVIISQVIKHIIQKPRPINQLIIETGYSFPSGHATIAMAFFGILIYLFKDEIKNKLIKHLFIIINILLILLISFSRIYLNVHYLSDVLAGLILGLICIFVAIFISKKYLK